MLAAKILTYLMLITLLFTACGEDKNTCDKARDVQKRICKESNSEKCFPCPCVLKDKDYEIVPNEQGVPDLQHSTCVKPDSCEGSRLTWAEQCIEFNDACDPRYYAGVKMFDQGVSEIPLYGICDGDW
jgi:hypothetical protein